MAGLSALIEARKAGATKLRTVWNGFGDDGCFTHKLLNGGAELQYDIDLDDAIASCIKQHGIVVDGIMNGSVGILEIDLLTGDARYWDAQQPIEEGRFAEFLLRCELAGTTTVKAELVFGKEFRVKAKKRVQADSWLENESLTDVLNQMLYRANYSEEREGVMDTICSECGRDVSLQVDVPSKTYTFSGQGKNVVVNVPNETLDLRTFKVNLVVPPASA